MSLGKTYQKLLKEHFLATQAVQTALLMGAGDVLAQSVVERKNLKEYEPMRTVEFAFLGAVLVGPAVTVWYRTLAKHFGTKKSPSVTLKKVACDQLLFAPSFLPVFITSLNVLHGKNVDHIKKELLNKYSDILITNWKVWPLVQLVNFYFMPLHYQVLLAQSVALFWNTYLCWKTSQ